jgi:hypothetical protein
LKTNLHFAIFPQYWLRIGYTEFKAMKTKDNSRYLSIDLALVTIPKHISASSLVSIAS